MDFLDSSDQDLDDSNDYTDIADYYRMSDTHVVDYRSTHNKRMESFVQIRNLRSDSKIEADCKKKPSTFSTSDLQYFVAHIILPSEISKSRTFCELSHDDDILIHFLTKVVDEAGQEGLVGFIPNTSASIKNWRFSLETGDQRSENNYGFRYDATPNKTIIDAAQKVSEAISSLKAGDLLPFYFKYYNLTLLISKPKSILDPESVVISWFHVQASPIQIISYHKLKTSYPEYSFNLPYSDLMKSKVFAEKLISLCNGMYTFATPTKDGNDKTSMLVQWLTVTLMGLKDPASISVDEMTCIQKSVRDEPLASSEFRRSGLWSTIKVSMHLSLVEELGLEIGTYTYKLIQVEVLRRIIEENKWKQDDTSMEVLSKLARKLEKLKKLQENLNDSHRDLSVLGTSIAENAIKTMSRLKAKLDRKWEGVSNLDTVSDSLVSRGHTMDLNVFHTHRHPKLTYSSTYTFGETRMKHLEAYVADREKSIADANRHEGVKSLRYDPPFDRNPDQNKIISFEKSIRQKDLVWSPSELREQFKGYIKNIERVNVKSPITWSRIIITLLKSVQISDQMATAKNEVLLEHKLFDFDIMLVIQKLILATREETDIATDMELYFHTRQNQAISSYPILIAGGEPGSNSPGVRIAKMSQDMQNLKTTILSKISKKEKEKNDEIRIGKEKYDELQIAFRDAICTCSEELQQKRIRNQYSRYRNKRNFNHHESTCSKQTHLSQMQSLKIRPFVFPIPMDLTSSQDAVMFELMIPEDIATMRDILFVTTMALAPEEHYNSMNNQMDCSEFNPWTDKDHRQSLMIDTDLSCFNLSFCLGTKNKNPGPISVTEPDYKFLVRNDPVKFTTQRYPQCYRPKISFHTKFPTSSPYTTLEPFLENWTHTPNQILAQANDINLQVTEFIEFGSLRATHRLQYRNIMKAITCQTLTFQNEEVCGQIIQALWQIGPIETIDGIGRKRAMHEDLHHTPFVQELVKALNDLVTKTEDNWLSSFTIIMVIAIGQKIAEFNEKVRPLALTLLRRCRVVVEKWLKTIENIISEDPQQSTSLTRYLADGAICGALSFSFSSDLLPEILQDKVDAVHWLTFMRTFQDEITAKDGYSRFPENSLRRSLIDLIREAGRSIATQLNTIIKDSPAVLDEFVKARSGVNRALLWSPIGTTSEHQLYQAEYQQDPKIPETTCISINVLSGEYLLDGNPNLKLPYDILRSEDYRRIFKDMEFRVRSSGKRKIYRTDLTKGATYEFEVRPSGSYSYSNTSRYHRGYDKPPLIIEKRRTTICELIPLDLIREDLPFLLVDAFSHWWNREDNTVEFRPKSFLCNDFEKSKYVLNLDTKNLVEVRTKNVMTYIGEGTHDKILKILTKLELPKYILIWQEAVRGNFIAKLPRFGLSFRWKKNHLVCQEYNDMIVRDEFQLKTLIGFNKLLVLEEDIQEAFLRTKKILVPHGQLEIQRRSSNSNIPVLDVEIENEKLRQPPYFAFDIMDDRFRTLHAGQSSAAWLYLAALHAATASPLQDPFTGLTGTEMAVSILQSGHCWSCKPYDKESLATLKFIQDLSPKRKIDERSNKQTTVIVEGLSSYAAFDGYCIITHKLLEDSNRLSFLYPKLCEMEVSNESTTSANPLNIRAYWKHLQNYNSAAWIQPQFLPDFAKPPEFFALPYKPCFKTGDLTYLHIISRMTSEWNAEPTVRYDYNVSAIQALIYGNNQRDLQGLKPNSVHDLSTLQPDTLRAHWIQLYAKALRCGLENLKSEWKLLLCDFIFKLDKVIPSNNINIDHLRLLHLIAINHEKFPDPPSVSVYRNISETVFNKLIIQKILEGSKISYEDWTDRTHGYGYRWNHPDPQAYTEEKNKWETETKSEIIKLISDSECHWDNDTTAAFPVSTKLDSNQASMEVNNKLQSWKNNIELKLFLAKVIGALTDIIATLSIDRSKSIFDPTFNFSSLQKLSLQPKPRGQTIYPQNFQLSKLASLIAFDYPVDITIFKTGIQDIVNDGFKNYNLKRAGYSRQIDTLWTRLENLGKQEQYRHLQAAGLLPRIVPIKVLPELMSSNTPDSIKDLIGAIAVLWTHEQRARRILKFILAGEKKEINLKRELETAGHTNWSPKAYPEWLLLELEMNVMIREVQVNVAKHMLNSSEDSSVTQLNMGEGKTSLIVPMLVSTLTESTDTDFCVRVTVLKSLYGTNYKSLSHTLGGLLNRRLYAFPCSRDLDISLKQAGLVHQIHQEIIQKKGVVLTVPEYRLSWELRAYESAEKDTPMCRELLDLATWLHDKARDVLDESDEILSVKYQKVYAMGKSGQIDRMRWKVAQAVLKKLPKKLKEIEGRYDSCIEVESGQTDVFTRCRVLNYTDESDRCYQELIGVLAQEFVDEEFLTLEQQSKELMIKFLTNPVFTQLEHETLLLAMNSEPLKNKFEKATVMAELFIHPGVLQSALSKRWKVNYGVNPKGQRQIAVPFRAKDVAHEKTEFGHPLMAIVLTQLSYYYSGLQDEHLLECFRILKTLDNPVVEFDSWMNSINSKQRPNVSYQSVNLEFPHQRMKLFNSLRRNVDTIDFWLSHSVFRKELKNHPDKITCSSWDLCHSRNRTSGFSGTNDMSDLLPLSIKQNDLVELNKTNIEVQTALEKSNGYQSFDTWITTSEDVLLKLTEIGIQVLIDAGALMTDLTNFQVAIAWLKINPEIEAVVYFNDDDELTVRTREDLDCPFGLSPFSEKLDLCAVYLDDEHTRGTDLRFLDGTTGCVTLGGQMTRDKLVQACMRLRLLQSGRHHVFFLASRESHNQIKAMMPDPDGEPRAVDIISWVHKNTEDMKNQGLVFWANSGLNFVKMQIALSNFKATNDFQSFAMQIQERSAEGPATYKTQAIFLNVLRENFQRTLQIRNSGALGGPDVLAIQDSILEVISSKIPDKRCFSNNLDEEQEREIEKEVEQEVQVSRPRPEIPCKHNLDTFIRNFIRSGILDINSNAITVTRFNGLYETRDHFRVVQSDRVLRPVNWIASGVDLNKKSVVLLLSPYEVNELMPEYWKGNQGASIHMFVPRLRPGQPIVVNVRGLQLSGHQGSQTITDEALANLHMFSGSLYFDPETNEKEYYSNASVELSAFIKKAIQDRHQYFPEKSDVFMTLK